MYECNECDGNELVFLKETFPKSLQSNIMNKQLFKTTTDYQIFEDSDFDENSANHNDEEDYGNIISLLDDNTLSPQIK